MNGAVFWWMCCLCMVTVLCAGCGEQQPVAYGYVNEAAGFQCNPPVGWTVVENASGADRVVAWVTEGAYGEQVFLNISGPFRLDVGLSASIYADLVTEEAALWYANVSVISRGWIQNIEGVDSAHELVYTYTTGADMMKVWQVAVEHARWVFVISFIASVDAYGVFVDDVGSCIVSFDFI